MDAPTNIGSHPSWPQPYPIACHIGPAIKGLPMLMVIGTGPCYPCIHMIDRGGELLSHIRTRTANHMQR
jgi:hypothetical protein